AQLDEPLDPLRFLIADFATDQTDRHASNWLITTVRGRPAARRMVVIDNALAFSYPEEVALDADLPGRGAFLDLLLSNLQHGRLTPAEIRDECTRLTDAWARAIGDVDLSALEPRLADEVRHTLETRVATLADREPQHLEVL